MRQSARLSGGPKILLLTHTWGFPDGYAATVRARLIGRVLVESGAQVRVLCTRVSERPPDVVNTESSGSYKGIAFVYTTGATTRLSSFLKRRVVDGRGLVSALRSIAGMRRAGELGAVYLWSTGVFDRRTTSFCQGRIHCLPHAGRWSRCIRKTSARRAERPGCRHGSGAQGPRVGSQGVRLPTLW